MDHRGGAGDDDPYEGLSNPTKQARRLMDERGIRRATDDSDNGDDGASDGGGAGGEFSAEQAKRMQSLENELADTKRLLMDVLYDKQQLEKDKAELQRLVEELSGGGAGAIVGSSGKNDPVADRAKATILALRLKRVEQKRAQFIDFVKTTSRGASTAAKRLKTSTSELRAEVQSQFERMQEQLTDSVSDFESMVDAFNRRAMGFATAAGQGSGEGADGDAFGASTKGGDAYAGIAAAVQQQQMQQRSVVLTADHPLVQRLNVLYNTIDTVVDSANSGWREMRCFAEGTAPQLQRPRRYIDVMSNANNYVAQAERLKRCLEYTQGAQRLHGDLRLPCAMRHSAAIVTQAHDALQARVDDLFDALRTVRTSVVVKAKNLTTAFRIFSACDAVQHDAARLYTQYLKLSKGHVQHALRFMARLLRFSKIRLNDFELADVRSNAIEVGECPSCAAPVACEDCYRVLSSKHAVLRVAYERHRKSVGDFTIARVEHFKRLRGLVDDAIKILTVARLVPLEREAGAAAAADAVDTMIRKPQPPSSINYFTRQRKSEENRMRLAHGQLPDDSASGLGVRPPTLDERRRQLLRMVAETDLRHLSPREFPPDELARAAGFDVLPYATPDGQALGFDETLVPRSTASRRSARALPSVRLPGAPPASGGGLGFADAARVLSSSTARCRPTVYDGGAVTDGSSPTAATRMMESHLPDLAGPREAEATARHQERLDAARRHHARLATAEGARGRVGGSGPGTARPGTDHRRGFNTTGTPRTLTERMLGNA